MPHSIDPDALAREFIRHFPGRAATLSIETPLRAAARRRKPPILLACMPKSGSTFLCNAIAAATGYPRHPLVYAYFRNAQDLYLPALVKALSIPTVTQQHVVATRPNLELIDVFHLKTIVLVRNLFDVVVSLREHCLREGPHTPAGFIDESFSGLSKARQYDLLIDVAVPWYFGFYASWFRASHSGDCRPLWLTYETLFADPIDVLQRLLEFCESPQDRSRVREAVARARESGSRFNKGIAGRGNAELGAHQRRRIASYADWYPTVDFSLIGLPQGERSAA